MTYSRANPSPRYRDLVALYRRMHEEGEQDRGFSAEETFPGKSLPPHAGTIKFLLDHFGSKTLLDYGAGKGMGYRSVRLSLGENGPVYNNLLEFWQIEATLYDPAYAPYTALPSGKFDAVISTDVMEHVPEEDVPWIVDELFAYARHFVFVTIAIYPAKKKLPTGENAHTTLKTQEWWTGVLQEASRRHGNVPWLAFIEDIEVRDGQSVRVRHQAGPIRLKG